MAFSVRRLASFMELPEKPTSGNPEFIGSHSIIDDPGFGRPLGGKLRLPGSASFIVFDVIRFVGLEDAPHACP